MSRKEKAEHGCARRVRPVSPRGVCSPRQANARACERVAAVGYAAACWARALLTRTWSRDGPTG